MRATKTNLLDDLNSNKIADNGNYLSKFTTKQVFTKTVETELAEYTLLKPEKTSLDIIVLLKRR